MKLDIDQRMAQFFDLSAAEMRAAPGHLQGKRFEQFVAWFLLRRWHVDVLDHDDLHRVLVGDADDNAIDVLAIFVDGVLVRDPEHARGAVEASDDPHVQYVFAQITGTPRFARQKMNGFVAGVDTFFRPQNYFAENERVTEMRQIKDALRATGGARESACLYYVARGQGGEDATITGGPDSPLGWRRYAEDTIRAVAGLDSAPRVEVVNRRRLVEIVREVDEQDAAPDEVEAPDEGAGPRYVRSIRVPHLVPMPDLRGRATGFLGYVGALQLIELLERPDGQGLLDAAAYHNVRGFQGLDNEVNAEIAKTVAEGPHEEFLLRNNGVTLVAERASWSDGQLELVNYQIVNGWQTSSVLYRQRQHLQADGVFVPLKVVVTADPDLRDGIVRSTNRQTAIGDVQQFGNLPIIRRLAALFSARRSRGVGEALWLERRAGEFREQASVAPDRVLGITELLSAVTAVHLNQPHLAAQGPAALLGKVPRNVFREDHELEPYLLAGAIASLAWRWLDAQPSGDWRRFEPQLCYGMGLLVLPGSPPPDLANAERVSASKEALERLEQRETAQAAMETVGAKLRDVVAKLKPGSQEQREAHRVKRTVTVPLANRLRPIKNQFHWTD